MFENIDTTKLNIALDLSQRHSVLYAKCRNAIIEEFKGKNKGSNMGRKAVRNMLFILIREIGGVYHSPKDKFGKHFPAVVKFTDGSEAKFIK